MSKVQRELELVGSADLVALLREAFQALSGGRQLPDAATTTEHTAYSHESSMYRTARGDGLTITEILDYGEFHHARFFKLLVEDKITVDVDNRARPSRVVFNLSASAELVDDAMETVKRIATAVGLTARAASAQ